jgi:hypothetical protein
LGESVDTSLATLFAEDGLAVSQQTLFRPRGLPEDSDEAELWRRGVHVRYSFLAVIVCMAAFALVKYFTGDY